MKIKPEHFDHIASAITALLQKAPDLASDYEQGRFPRADRVKDLQTRFNWDLFFGAGLSKYASRELYSYLDDSHITTALKSIWPKIEREFDIAELPVVPVFWVYSENLLNGTRTYFEHSYGGRNLYHGYLQAAGQAAILNYDPLENIRFGFEAAHSEEIHINTKNIQPVALQKAQPFNPEERDD